MTDSEEMQYFQLLKKKIGEKFREAFQECSENLNEWKRQDITNFQEQLQKEVNGYVSEKWFYTHLKPAENTKLPRIDMLNMLAQYTGYENWGNFLSLHTELVALEEPASLKTINWRKYAGIFSALTGGILLIWFATGLLASRENQYEFCFVDAYKQAPVKDTPIEIQLIQEQESPVMLQADANGCFKGATKNEKLTFVVKANYYKTDTIIRKLENTSTSEIIRLKPDDYALMIHVFSNAKIEDWERRRKQLDMMLDDEVQIIQIDKDSKIGMEIYNKEEFIDKMTMPLNSLKDIEIIETQYRRNQIVLMRFIQK